MMMIDLGSGRISYSGEIPNGISGPRRSMISPITGLRLALGWPGSLSVPFGVRASRTEHTSQFVSLVRCPVTLSKRRQPRQPGRLLRVISPFLRLRLRCPLLLRETPSECLRNKVTDVSASFRISDMCARWLDIGSGDGSLRARFRASVERSC